MIVIPENFIESILSPRRDRRRREKKVAAQPPRLLDIDDASQYLGVSDKAVRQLILQGELGYIQRVPGRSPYLLDVKDLDRWIEGNKVWLDVGTTKNGEGREVTMTDAIRALLTQCVHGKGPDDFVFTRENGEPVRDFRRAWTKLCTAAKLPDLLVHDLRRSAARAYRRAGVAESVIMKIGGWKTREIFERYNIKDSKDVAEAVAKREEKRTHELSHDFSHDSQVAAGSKTARLN